MELLEKIQQKQKQKVKRLTVGPVPSHPKILKMMGAQYFSTRDAVFVEVMPAIQDDLKISVGTEKNFVILEHGSGSSGMCTIGNHLLYPGAKVLVINTGKFGERWTKIAKKRQCAVEEMEVPWGKVVDWDAVGAKLKELQSEFLLIQHSETSTGSVHSLADARKAMDKNSPNTLLIVDAISSWGSLPIEMDKNQIDAVVGCSQKGFMLPTGLHLLVFSEKALAKINENNEQKRITDFSHNPAKDIEVQAKGKPRFSMDSNAIMALYYFSKELLPKMGGWSGVFKKAKSRAKKLRKAITDMGLELFSDCPSDVVTAIKTPAGMDSKAIRKELEAEGFEVNGSQDAAKFEGIRIGNMGYITPGDISRLIVALKKAYKK